MSRPAAGKTPDTDFRSALVDHVPALRRYALGLTRKREDADDLVHDCLAQAIRKQHLWRPGSNLKSWLFTLLHNLFINEYRRRKARGTEVPFDTAYFRSEVTQGQPSDVTLSQLDRALGELPSEQREVVMLVSVQGFSYMEAAEIMQVPLGTIRSRLSRARGALRRRLAEGAERAAVFSQ